MQHATDHRQRRILWFADWPAPAGHSPVPSAARNATRHRPAHNNAEPAGTFPQAGAAPRALESPICRNTCESRFGRRVSRRSLRVDRSPSTCRGRRPAGVSTRVEGNGRAALASPCGAKCKAACARCCASSHAVWDTTPGGIIDYQCTRDTMHDDTIPRHGA